MGSSDIVAVVIDQSRGWASPDEGVGKTKHCKVVNAHRVIGVDACPGAPVLVRGTPSLSFLRSLTLGVPGSATVIGTTALSKPLPSSLASTAVVAGRS